MNYQLQCKQHQKPTKYFARDQENNQIVFFCSNCDLRETQIFPIKELEDYKQQTKSMLLDIQMKEKELNLSVLKKLEEYLIQYKNEQSKKLEEIIHSIQQDQIYITQNSEKVIQEISNCASSNYDELFQFINSNRITQILKNNKQQLLNSLNEILSKPVIFDAFSLLSTFPFKESIQLSNAESFNNCDFKCLVHNEEVIAIDYEKQNKNFLCQKCIPEAQGQIITINDGIKLLNDYYQMIRQLCNNYQNKLEEVASIIKQGFQSRQEILKRKLDEAQILLNKMLISKQKFIQKQIEIVNTKQLNLKFQLDIEKLHQLSENSEGLRKLIDDKLFVFDDLLKNWKAFSKPDLDMKKLFQVSDQIQKLLIGKEEDFYQIKNSAFKINYQLLSNSIKQYAFCGAIATNSQGNLVVAGCGEAINVFAFNSGILNNLQQLRGHQGIVLCLTFVKNKENRFLSASQDGTIKIWDQLKLENWSEIQTLKGHINGVYALISNSNGDQIFSGGADHQVRCWSEKEEQWNNSQIFQDHQQVVYCVNLNESENKLIS